METSIPEFVPRNSSKDKTNLRRSERIRKNIEHRSAWQPTPRAFHVETEVIIPKSYSDAISGAEKLEWQTAIDQELESLRAKELSVLITHIPDGKRPVGSR